MPQTCKPLRLPIFFLGALAILCATLPAPAGPRAGTLSGVVLSKTGMPVASAQISWQSADGTAPHAAQCDARGHFQIAAVRPGLYEVRAAAAGRWSDWEHNVLVRTGADTSITLHLVRTSPPSSAALRVLKRAYQ